MAWQEDLKNIAFRITTGEGSVWSPKWMPSTFEVNFNHSVYDYPSLSGSFVDRREVKGDTYQFNIIFDGASAIENGEQFIEASKDNRPWRVEHPYYGSLRVQPTKLSIDNSDYNVYKIKIQCIETITPNQPQLLSTPDSALAQLKEITDVSISNSYQATITTPDLADLQNMQSALSIFERIQSAAIRTQDTLSQFRTTLSNAAGLVNELLQDATSAIRAVTDLINFPFRVLDTIRTRFNILRDTFDELKRLILRDARIERIDPIDPEVAAALQGLDKSEKAFLETLGAACVTSACLITVVEPEPQEIDESLSSEEQANATVGRSVVSSGGSIIGTPGAGSPSVSGDAETVSVSALDAASDPTIGQLTGGLTLSTALILGTVGVTQYEISQDYPSRQAISDQIQQVVDFYNDYLLTVDAMSSSRSDDTEAYTPSAAVASNVQQMVSVTIRRLAEQIFESAQEREIILEDDTDIINLTHRLFGLDSADQNIIRLMNLNNLSLNQMLVLPKGRAITYYV